MSEDLKKKFQLLSEYAFIKDKTYKPQDQIEPNLLEDDEDPLADFNSDDENVGDEAPEGDTPEGGEMDGLEDMDSDETDIEPAVEPQPGEEDDSDLPADEIENDTPELDNEGDVELDVTELVQGSEDAKASADEASAKIDQLLGSIDQLLQNSDKIDALGQRMADIENEFIKRNPTKEEKLEMQSLHSAPYNIKLGDYWSDKGDYIEDVSKTGPSFNDIDQPQGNSEEMVLTQGDVDRTYSETSVKDSFDYDEDEVDDYNP